jgi:hypothetical protein
MISTIKYSTDPNLPNMIKNFKLIIDGMKLRKQYKGIKQSDIIQNICQFMPAKDCFLKLQYVCKDWHLAINQIRFEQQFEMYNLYHNCIMTEQDIFNSNLFIKIISHAKDIHIDHVTVSDSYYGTSLSLINNHAQNLTSLTLETDMDCSPIIKRCRKSLDYLVVNSESLEILLHHSFPKLEHLGIYIDEDIDCKKLFQLFKNISKNMEKLQWINLKQMYEINSEKRDKIADFIVSNLEKHCVDAFAKHLQFYPFQMITTSINPISKVWEDLDVVRQSKYISKVEYLNLSSPLEGLSIPKIQNILSYFENLKGINIAISKKGIDKIYGVEETKYQNILSPAGTVSEINKKMLLIDFLNQSKVTLLSNEQWREIDGKLCKNIWTFDFDI